MCRSSAFLIAARTSAGACGSSGVTASLAAVGQALSLLYVLLGLVDQMPGTKAPSASSGTTATLQSDATVTCRLAKQTAYGFERQPLPVEDSSSSCR